MKAQQQVICFVLSSVKKELKINDQNRLRKGRNENMIPTKEQNPNGLHQRYLIKKIVGHEVLVPHDAIPEEVHKVGLIYKGKSKWVSIGNVSEDKIPNGSPIRAVTKKVDEGSEYFVLRLDTGGSDIEHIKACRIGIHAYADAIEHHFPDLANDLRTRYPLLP